MNVTLTGPEKGEFMNRVAGALDAVFEIIEDITPDMLKAAPGADSLLYMLEQVKDAETALDGMMYILERSQPVTIDAQDYEYLAMVERSCEILTAVVTPQEQDTPPEKSGTVTRLKPRGAK